MSQPESRPGSVDALKEDLNNSWNYTDVLTLAIARTESPRLATRADWHKVIYDIQGQTESEHPELLDGVLFDARDPERPFSQQVDSLFSNLNIAGVLIRSTKGNDSWYELTPEDKQNLVEHFSPRLEKYEQEIAGMTAVIDERLGR